jgi:hypothetical protein
MDAEQIERIRETLRTPITDGIAARAVVEALRPMVSELIEAYSVEASREGGAFGRRMLEALEVEILKAVNGRAELSESAELLSISATVSGAIVVVDSRIGVKCL